MARMYAPPSQDFLQKTLGAQLLAGTTAAATLNNVTGIQNLPGVFIVDRVDTNGVETPSKREVIAFTATSGSTVTTLTRNADGSGSDQDHSVGSVVEFSPDVVWAQSVYDALSTVVVPSTGVIDTTKVVDTGSTQMLFNKMATGPSLSSAKLLNPTITGGTGASLSLVNANLLSPIITTPTINGGTGASLSLIAPLINTYDGWVGSTDTWVFATAQTFTITGVDRTGVYTKGTRLKFTNSGTKYATVISSAFGTDTTVTIATNTDYTIANAAITAPQYSYNASPAGYPGWFNYTSGISWNSTPPSGTTTTVAQFSVVGTTVYYRFYQNNTVAGTTNTIFTINQPIPSNVSAAIFHDGGSGYVSSAEYSSSPNQLVNAIYTTVNSNTTIKTEFGSLSAKAGWAQGFYAF